MTSPHSQEKNSFLMLGDSLVAGYDWQHRMPHYTIHNCGVPGATTSELLHSLPRIQARYTSPQLIMIMIGTNDVAMNNFSFTHDLKTILTTIRTAFPTAEVFVNSLLPMRLPHLGTTTIARLNSEISTGCRLAGCRYIDLHTKFLQSDDLLFQADGVHLTVQAYELWARTIMEHIAFPVEND